MVRISIFNYGVGNLYSLRAALKREGVETYLTRNVPSIRDADALLLPGVGNFTEATRKLPLEGIRDLALAGRPLLGVCLGLQLCFEKSDEGPGRGLCLLRGNVRRLPPTVKVPQIGWNVLKIKHFSELVEGVPDEPWVYYMHSYYPATRGPWVLATSEYGLEFPSLVANKNIFGTQFHPEKSGRAGRAILSNFLRLIKR